MTNPPADDSGTPDASRAPDSETVSLDKPPTGEPPFDPYRFGAPEHPVPPEYAPPGYVPPPPAMGPPLGQPPVAQPPVGQPMPYATYPGYAPYTGQPGAPGQPYPYPPPPYFSQYPQPPTGNGKATAGLVLGILSIVFFWTTIFDGVAIILALIFGFLGLRQSKLNGSGRTTAIIGIVCAFVGAALAIAFTVVVLTRIQTCINSYSSGSAAFNSCVRHRL